MRTTIVNHRLKSPPFGKRSNPVPTPLETYQQQLDAYFSSPPPQKAATSKKRSRKAQRSRIQPAPEPTHCCSVLPTKPKHRTHSPKPPKQKDPAAHPTTASAMAETLNWKSPFTPWLQHKQWPVRQVANMLDWFAWLLYSLKVDFKQLLHRSQNH